MMTFLPEWDWTAGRLCVTLALHFHVNATRMCGPRAYHPSTLEGFAAVRQVNPAADRVLREEYASPHMAAV